MTALAPPPQTTRPSMQPRDDAEFFSSSQRRDPFWQSTPRSTPALSALMTAVQPVSASRWTAAPSTTVTIHQHPPQTPQPGIEMLQICRPPLNCTQVVPSPPVPATAPKPKPPTVTARRPQCTHMNITRLYGNHVCVMCGKVPSLGWLYSCRQDHEQPDRAADPDTFPVVPNKSSYLDVQARLAESLGMGLSVVQGIRNSDYSFEQVDKLIEQKKHLLATIRRVERDSAEDTPQLHSVPQRSGRFGDTIASLGAQAAPPANSTVTVKPTTAEPVGSTPKDRESKGSKLFCSFQVCHACRPFFQDRQYMSFERVISGTLPALTELDMLRLPMLNACIVRNLGLRTPPPVSKAAVGSRSIDITMQNDGYEDEDASDLTRTDTTMSVTDTDNKDLDPYPCPGAGICPLYSRNAGCAYDADFNDGQRALNHGFGPSPHPANMTPDTSLSRLRRVKDGLHDTPDGASSSTASSISLPTPCTVPLTPLTPTKESFDQVLARRLGKSSKAVSMLEVLPSEKRQACSGFGTGLLANGSSSGDSSTTGTSSSSLGSELEVAGGVALTEEAVETGQPDIFTDARE